VKSDIKEDLREKKRKGGGGVDGRWMTGIRVWGALNEGGGRIKQDCCHKKISQKKNL